MKKHRLGGIAKAHFSCSGADIIATILKYTADWHKGARYSNLSFAFALGFSDFRYGNGLWRTHALLRRRVDRMSTALVSVVIPARDSAATIARALESALCQTYGPLEIVVVDDCSRDETRKIVQSYEAKGVRLLALETHHGASAARNEGVKAASGEFIAFLDSDDEWLNTKLEKQGALMRSDERLSLVYCGSNLISTEGADLGDIYRGRTPAIGPDAWKALLAANFIATPAVLARRKDLMSLGGFDPALKIGEDQDMWIRLALLGHIGCVPESLVRVHMRVKSLSNLSFQDQLRYTLPMIERHIAALKHRLNKSEIRKIRGERLGRIGRASLAHGLHVQGLGLIVRSMMLGYQPLISLLHLVTSVPPTKWLRHQIRRNRTRVETRKTSEPC